MKRETYMFGARGEQYGIWNTVRKCWQFGICEDTPMLAEARLFQKIGDDARKFRFTVRVLPPELRRKTADPAVLVELERKDRELKETKKALRELTKVLADEHHELQEAKNRMRASGMVEPATDNPYKCLVCVHRNSCTAPGSSPRCKETYEHFKQEGCHVCGVQLRAGKPVELWECDECGALFCMDCFTRSEGLEAFGDMLTSGGPMLCPECHRKAVSEDD